MRAILAVVVFAISCSAAFGTVQRPDELRVGSALHWVYGFRLQHAVEMRLREYLLEHKLPHPVTDNWDGYYADLEVRGSALFLVALRLDVSSRPEDIREAFGFEIPSGGVKADWFTGELIEGFGEQTELGITSDERVFKFQSGTFDGVSKRKSRRFERLQQRSKESEANKAVDPTP